VATDMHQEMFICMVLQMRVRGAKFASMEMHKMSSTPLALACNPATQEDHGSRPV
jgi:hypothetical protein